jgi:ribosomal protein L19
MASYFKEGDKLSFDGFKGIIIRITETYRKNVIVLKVSEQPKRKSLPTRKIETVGIFEYPDGTLEFMAIID